MRAIQFVCALAVAALATPARAYRLEDSLRGGTVGNPVGGSFGPQGWTVTARTDRIWYVLPRLGAGSIEFTLSGVTHENLLVEDNELFAMYEGGYGIEEPVRYNPEFRNNHYKCLLRVYGQAEEGRAGAQKLMWGMCPSGAPGYDQCGCGSFFREPFGGDTNWDGTPQRIRIEWGNGRTRLLRNAQQVVSIDWSESGLIFGPSELHMSLGTSRPDAVGGAAMPIGAVFSDLVIEGEPGPLATCEGPALPEDAGVPGQDAGPGPGPVQVLELIPTDDVTVWSGAPDTVAPDVDDLACASSGGQPEEVAYLRFDGGARRGRLQRAELRLHARDIGSARGDGAAVHAVAETGWSEGTLTFSTRPAWDPAVLGRTGPTRPGAWYAVDVTAGVAGWGPMALALVGGEDGSHFSSKEDSGGALPPRLVLEIVEEPAPAVDAGPPGPVPDGAVPPPVPDAGPRGGDDASGPLLDAAVPGGGRDADIRIVPPPGAGAEDAELAASDAEGGCSGCASVAQRGAPAAPVLLLALGLLGLRRRRRTAV